MAIYKKFAGLVNYTGSYGGYATAKAAGKLIFANITSGDIPSTWYPEGETEHSFPIYVVCADLNELIMPSYSEFAALRSEVEKIRYDLTQLSEEVKTKIDTITGENNELNNSEYVNVKATKSENGTTVTLSSTVKTVASPTLYDEGLTPATINGLATDGYVNDSITNALTWEVTNELLDFNGRRL